jgi:uncharacterized protein YraI
MRRHVDYNPVYRWSYEQEHGSTISSWRTFYETPLATTICRRIACHMNIYAMKRNWFKSGLGMLLLALTGAAAFFAPTHAEASREAVYQTDVIITVTYVEDINVRGGPNTVDYPIVGRLAVGETAPALGVSPKREWVQIAYPDSPTGTGWVYAAYVTVSGGELQVVEPPPTPTPPVTATVDQTLVAAFNTQPTQTRLPTFTPPPPLTVPAFSEAAPKVSTGIFGIFIVSLGLIGGIGLALSYFWRR